VERLRGPTRARRLARFFACTGEHDRATQALTHVRSETRRETLDVLLLRARVAPSADTREARGAAALRGAEHDGYARVFVDENDWVRPALAALVADWPTPYAADALHAVIAERPRAATHVAALLTPREQQVVRYLATSMSLREIARALFVSHNTVKSHVRNIYRKIGVRERHEIATLAFPPPSRVELA
jgi:LuxR family maltose regulon positive regulatory protein